MDDVEDGGGSVMHAPSISPLSRITPVLSNGDGPSKSDGDLTVNMKNNLMLLLDGGKAIQERGWWILKNENKILTQSILSLYDRCLVKIVVETKFRRRHSAELTQIGYHVARDLKTQESLRQVGVSMSAPHGISEEAARFIVEVV